jgi:hypothetical protein
VGNSNSIDQQFFQTTFDGLVSSHTGDRAVLVKYFGDLNQENISKLEGEVESKIIENSVAKGPLKKIFFISVETLQNMLIHGHKNTIGEQKNFFILSKNHTKIQIISANLINNAAVDGLTRQIETINSFEDPAALKQFYMEHLENNQLSEKGGAGLGFITIAMKSGNKLGVSFDKIDDNYSLFLLTSTVNLE